MSKPAVWFQKPKPIGTPRACMCSERFRAAPYTRAATANAMTTWAATLPRLKAREERGGARGKSVKRCQA